MAKTLQFSPVVKDRLFYNRFKYCIGFTLEELSCLKTLDHEYIDMIISRRKEWRAIHHQRLHRIGKTNIPTMQTILGRRSREITEETVDNLHNLAKHLLALKDEYKLVTSVDQGWLYSNNHKVIQDLYNIQSLKNKYCTKAVIDRPTNTIKLKSAKHTQRSYFRVSKVTAVQKDTLKQFFINQQEHIRPSPALLNWFDGDYHRTQDYFFVDHTGESWLVMLALVHGGLIRKTVDIIQG